uniref:Phospholipid-transporting ATPase n=1 Tax=Pyxicephalus adspersus TaxID=30357 RepID=A0AAV3AP01_PYXAD|nr:TPA: hypothetical protein GDO54_009457 [Pyxicephalus adspersus]
MARPIQWARHRWQQVAQSENSNNENQGYTSLLGSCLKLCRNTEKGTSTPKHRVVIPCLDQFKDEYDKLSYRYKNNKIRTTNYTLLNFVPRNLFEQFHRAANLYFLFLVFLNWVPLVEAFQKEITMLPLLAVLTIIAIKDGLEDYRKYKLDKVINHLLTQVYCRKEKKFIECYWKDVMVGNFIKLRCDEVIPADMLLLHSSDPDGICHIETSSLDGETNLKQKQVVKGCVMDCEFEAEKFSSRIQCEMPNSDIGRFKGFLERLPSGQEKIGLNKENLLLRGCVVRNTEAVIGIVVYAGLCPYMFSLSWQVRKPSLIRSPMKSLEEIKQMFQRFSVRKISATSLLGGKDSSSEPPNNFVYKLPFFSKMKLASPTEADKALEASLDSAEETLLEGLEKSELADPADCPDKSSTCEVYYEAESPDEAALVHAARAYKCVLMSRTPDQVTVEVGTLGSMTFQLLHILPFDSVRKRMSVVVRHPLTNKVLVYTKGADSVIMDLLSPASNDSKMDILQEDTRMLTQFHLDKYARGGLRTLCIAKKVMTEGEYAEWLQSHFLAETSIDNREELLYQSAVRLETNLTLLGATGIEDRLQEGVPETIESLREAAIKIWMLTGDKEETAINIAYACKLLEHGDKILTLTRLDNGTCEMLINHMIAEVESHINSSDPLKKEQHFALIIDGKSLEFALQQTLQQGFLHLTRQCRAVICCRATPLQKSQVVKLVRNNLQVMTLAIGDGANDVSMIQVADVGIGISGQEGMQAVMSSDFAVSHFKHLRKLLLVHGHWCYVRLANMILYFFYKNVMFVNLLFWYQFFCGFSGTAMTDFWMLILFNLVFTSVPPIIYGILDKDVSADTLIVLPELYKSGQTSEAYKSSTFWITILDAFYQSLACFFIPYFTYFGSDMDIYSFGSFIITATLFVVLLHLLIESKSLAWIHWMVMGLSVLTYFIFSLALSAACVNCIPPANVYWIMHTHMADPVFYLVTVMSVVVALLPRYVYRIFQGSLFPTPQQKAKQLDVMPAEERLRAIKRFTPNIVRRDNSSFHVVPAGGSMATEDENAVSSSSPTYFIQVPLQ